MTVTNKSTVTLRILGCNHEPNETKEYPEKAFSTLGIYSAIGSCVIMSIHGERIFRNYGRLVAKEEAKKDAHGMSNILIASIAK